MKIGVVIGIAFVLLLALIAYSSLGNSAYRVKLCMSYNGQTACKTVSAKTDRNAVQAAVTGACADIASGVTDTMKCNQTEPASIEWLKRPASR